MTDKVAPPWAGDARLTQLLEQWRARINAVRAEQEYALGRNPTTFSVLGHRIEILTRCADELAAVAAVPLTPERFDLLDDPERGLHAVLTAHGCASRTQTSLVTALVHWAAEAYRSSAAPPSASAPAWQPIDTAPKDGTSIIVRFANDIHEPEVVKWLDDHWRTSDTCALWPPDFWTPLMPLPAPPPPAQEPQ